MGEGGVQARVLVRAGALGCTPPPASCAPPRAPSTCAPSLAHVPPLCAPTSLAGIGFGFSQLVLFGMYSLAFWYSGQLVGAGEKSFLQCMKVSGVCALKGGW